MTPTLPTLTPRTTGRTTGEAREEAEKHFEEAPPQEPDVLPSRWLAKLLFTAIAATVASVGVAWVLGGSAVQRSHAPVAPGPQVDEVEQTLVERTERGLDTRAAQRAELDRYAYVDRDAGIATIPIERAMQIVVERQARGAAR